MTQKVLGLPKKLFTLCFSLEPHILNALSQLYEWRVEE